MTKKVECTVSYSDESCRNYEETDLETAIRIFKTFPWEQENLTAEEKTGCFPTVAFGRLPIRKDSEYLNISGVEKHSFFLMIEAFSPTKIFGLIPWNKSAYLDVEPADESLAETFIRQFYTLASPDLFKWINDYKIRI